MASKSNALRKLELEYKYKHRRLDLVATFIQVTIPSLAGVAVVWLITASVDRLAGKFTIADIGIKFLGDLRISEAVAYVLTAGFGGWALMERKLKGDTIQRLSKRVVELERQIDPGRTSSRLTERGTTSPADKGL